MHVMEKQDQWARSRTLRCSFCFPEAISSHRDSAWLIIQKWLQEEDVSKGAALLQLLYELNATPRQPKPRYSPVDQWGYWIRNQAPD